VSVLKPVRGIRLNKSHPLARGLVGYWLFNEGSGNKVFDLSGNGNTGTITNAPWGGAKYGSGLIFSGDDYITITDKAQLTNTTFTFSIVLKLSSISGYMTIAGKGMTNGQREWRLDISYTPDANDGKLRFLLGNSSGSWVVTTYYSTAVLVVDQWYRVTITYDGTTQRIYIDGVEDSNNNSTQTLKDGSEDMFIGQDGASTKYLPAAVDHSLYMSRVLSASEIALLYREPFCMLDRAWRPGLIGGQIRQLAGTSTALSSVEGSLSVAEPIVELAGTIAGRSNVNGYLSLLDWTEGSWLTEALFNGMTANAFKLGTSLSLGWFWVRVAGCSVLYRGSAGRSMGEIDFANILAVSESRLFGTCDISPPSYISHNSGSTYFYVVRRFNNCGYQEHTLAAAVKVSIGSSGELAEPQPNNISSSIVEQVAGNKVRLTWFYCPLEHGSIPVSFNVYYDDRTGQIDYQNPLATIGYKGRKFYSFQSSALEAGGHLFAIRAEDAGGIENISLAQLKIQLDSLNPDAIDILRAEAV
jgi:hypothetical protein